MSSDYGLRRNKHRKSNGKDKIFANENDLKKDKRATRLSKLNSQLEEEISPNDVDDDSSDSDFSDQIDNMEEDELLFAQNGSKGKKTGGPVSRKNATDRTDGTNADELMEQEDEADDTVFIDNLPKDETSLKAMIKEVNQHIRLLGKQFFVEEDSEEELELKHNINKGNISAQEHNQQLETLKEKSHI